MTHLYLTIFPNDKHEHNAILSTEDSNGNITFTSIKVNKTEKYKRIVIYADKNKREVMNKYKKILNLSSEELISENFMKNL